MGLTIGGFLTDTFSWPWLFLVNLAPGIAVAVWLLIDIDKPDRSPKMPVRSRANAPRFLDALLRN